MISHIAFFSLSVLMHGKSPAAENWAASDAIRAVEAAWAWVETLPTKSTGARSPYGESNRDSTDEGAPLELAMRSGSGGSFVVLANAGQAFVDEVDMDETDDLIDPAPGATDQVDTDDEVDSNGDDDEIDPFTESDDTDSEAAAPSPTPETVKTQPVMSNVRYDNTLDDEDASSADASETDAPLDSNDIDASFPTPSSPPPEESSAEGSPPANEEATEEDIAPEDISDGDLNDENAIEEGIDADTEDGAEEDSDFRDFDSTFTMPGNTQPTIIHSTTPVLQPASSEQMSGQDTPVLEVQAPAPANNGLTNQLRSGISIARMTLKDQPSELIRVSVNTSMVVDLSGPVDGANIVDPNVADIIVPSPNRVIVVGKSMGTTQLVLTIGKGQAQEHRVFHVYVEPNVVVLADLIKSLAPRSDVRIGSLNGQLVLQGNVPDALTAKQIEDLARAYQGRETINHLSVSGTQQTMLRVVVAEVSKEASRQLGVNWAIGASDWSRDFFFANNVANINPTVFGSSGLADVLTGQQLYGVAGVANGANTNITFGFPKAEFQIFLNALRENGLARTLAEPNLVAISGQTATFLAGGEVPIPVAQAGASAGAITVEYHEFGVRLGFTPAVLGDQNIRLHVMTEVSEAVPTTTVVGGFPLFTFLTRRVESTIECGNGQTFAIAGLLSDRIRANASKIPGLGDLPVLGSLFSSTAYERSMTELVVLVTPQLVEPLDPQQVPPPPGSLMVEPNDFELFGLGKLEGSPSQERTGASAAPSETKGGTLVHRDNRRMPVHARLQGNWGFEEREPGALNE